ncbi:hypothetical protein L596_004214 [Steinernema carpocapsae]|uniref:Uncharacterized protein n=1 Tax=Steinernema carpocapsae TaxID=34508 RepID=A0A4U8UWR0_STECR|nr:hypothetical protein L596_004214 [Steinernema carpocapsae]
MMAPLEYNVLNMDSQKKEEAKQEPRQEGAAGPSGVQAQAESIQQFGAIPNFPTDSIRLDPVFFNSANLRIIARSLSAATTLPSCSSAAVPRSCRHF